MCGVCCLRTLVDDSTLRSLLRLIDEANKVNLPSSFPSHLFMVLVRDFSMMVGLLVLALDMAWIFSAIAFQTKI